MSTTIDQRVVEMRFDNKHFEQNVATTMSTLDKLKQGLNLTGATKGLENVSSAAKRCDLSSLGGAVQTVQAKFSALEVMAVTTLANITNSAVNAGKRIVSALTIEPIKTGFSEYETQINAVQTILANTSSKGTTLEDVNGALDTLNTYADKTIYNFTEMTRNIGTFTAAGVDLDTSVKSIQGIANLAAVSGSTSQQASSAMYQLSQALAAGKVSLMDWNSVVNAGMGGQVFQDALRRTSEMLGTGAEDAIKKYGSFRESLTQGEWLTTEVLTKTLEQFTMAAEEGSEEWNAFKKSLMEEGYTEAQAEEILKMANTATDAATKVKTFTQLFDTLKEAAQSGWTQTWEIIVGDFEEAKELLTNISNVIGEMINKSAEARNALLQGWKDAGGRSDLIEGFGNIFEGVMNVITPLKEAFREIFPPMTVDQLVNFTAKFKELTDRFREFTETHSDKIKSTFKGIFAVLDIVVTVIKKLAQGAVELIGNITGVGGGILNLTGSFGDWLVKLRDGIKETDIFGKAIDGIVDFISNAITNIKDFGKAMAENFKAPDNGFTGFITALWDILKHIGSEAGKIFSAFTDGLSEAFGGSFADNILNTGIFAGFLLVIKKASSMFKDFKNIIDDVVGEGGFFDNVKGVVDDVRDSFAAYQNSLNSKTLMNIAIAIGVLATAILILSTIDPGRLGTALTGITVLFAELMIAMSMFTKMDLGALKGVTKAVPIMIGLSVAITILAGAMKKLASLDWNGIAKGLVGVGLLMAEISIFLRTYKFDGKMTSTAVGIVILSSAILILGKAVQNFAGMKWAEIGKGLAAVGGLLLAVGAFTRITGNAKHVVSTGIAMVALGSAMKIFASAVKDFSGMNWETLGRGLAGMAGALLAVSVAMRIMPKNAISIGTGLVIVGASLKIIANAMSDFSSMSWTDIGKGLTAMGGALAELAIALKIMNGTLAGSAALIIAAGALAIITPVLKTLGNMSWEQIAKGLIVLAGAFAVIGVAGLLLGPLVPTLLGLSASFALFGLAIAGIGAGLTLIGVGLAAVATGFTALAAAGTAGAAAIVSALTIIIVGVADLIPTIAQKLGEAITAFCVVIGECAPQIAESVLKLITEVLGALATYAPQIVENLMDFLIGVLGGIADRLPELVKVAIDVIVAFFQGVTEALSGIDTSGLVKGIIGAGLMAALMFALSAVVSLIPGAMAGVLGMGVVIAELAIVLAAVGALAQIPGLSWLIEEGGNFLQKIGTAIGQFVGGLAGGIAEGFTASLPQIGTDLSNFMNNVKPFIEGAKSIDASMMEGVKTLAQTILILTAADLLNGITSWLTGGSSLTDFAAQLVPFGIAMKQYATSVAGIDSASVVASAEAAKGLAEVAKSIPNEGGLVSLFAGENNMADFATQLVPFGKALKSYSLAVVGIDTAAIESSAIATKSLVKVADLIPNEGGLLSVFTGDNQISDFAAKLVPFGKSLKKYSEAVVGVDTAAIANSATAAKALVKIADLIPNEGGLVSLFAGDNDIATFGSKLVPFGMSLKQYSVAVAGINTAMVQASVTAARSLVQFIKSTAGLDASGVATFANALAQLGKVSIQSFVNAFKNATPQFSTLGTGMMEAVLRGANSRLASLITFANSTVMMLVSCINAQSPRLMQAGVFNMTKYIAGLTSRKSGVKAAFTAVLAAAVNAVRSYYTRFYNAGGYLVQGFANGMSDSSYIAEQAAASVAAAAAAAAEAALDENSPSKVGYGIGKFFSVGFANGIVAYRDNLYKAGTDVADSAKTGLGDAVAKIKDIMDGDMDMNPTIRPVLDLSEIQNGANQLNGLFANQQLAFSGISSGVTVTNLSDIIEGMRTNSLSESEVVTAISNLRGDFGSLINAINGMQIRMDSGTVVGELINKIDTGLGQIANHKGRGN